ncbi:hypothetical protein OVA07_03020 [Novosphingobium sp. SL115]|uniref:hypothetical protein n=1 Tax=Novosphingobium sp. SL115 TaxID=2995150 RepID=UPI002274CE03|nr:hypothetical protein [Novosphingobium sp. SL115]MCY1669979.1 hypothetical protein [Novosphingobium sp. SL115]
MHTVRNRVAAKPRVSGRAKSPAKRTNRREPAFLLKHGNPPAFPAGLIIPPPRGAVIAVVPWPEAPVPPAAPKRKRPAKQRKVSSGRKAGPAKRPAPVAKAARKAASMPNPPVVIANAIPAKAEPMPTVDLLSRALAMQAAPEVELRVEARSVVPPADIMQPLSRAQSLVAAGHNGGFINAIGHWLQGAARWLATWRGQRARIAQARARHHALQSRFEALEALKDVAAEQSV